MDKRIVFFFLPVTRHIAAYKLPKSSAAIIHSNILPIPRILPSTENNFISPAPIHRSQNAIHKSTSGTAIPKKADSNPQTPSWKMRMVSPKKSPPIIHLFFIFSSLRSVITAPAVTPIKKIFCMLIFSLPQIIYIVVVFTDPLQGPFYTVRSFTLSHALPITQYFLSFDF